MSPELVAPKHLKPLIDALTRATYEPLKLIINTPPQHGKSELLFHFIAFVLLQLQKQILYITYSTDFAQAQMNRARPVAKRAGVPFVSDSKAFRDWRTTTGGSLYATGIGGDITGRPGGIIIIDDPIKDWVSAQSLTIRNITDNWLKSSVLTRMHPDSSIIIVQTRWHEDDVSGRLAKRGWEVINLSAISEAGTALWPEARPLSWLETQREQLGEHVFQAMYQGRPRPLGGELFGPPTFCEAVPDYGTYSIGVDLAYSSKTHADYSVSLVLKACQDGKFYVVDVVRKQVKAPEFALSLKAHSCQYPGSPMTWHAAGVEKGSADFLVASGIPIKVQSANTDKFSRSQRVSAAWASGKILIPRSAPWVQQFVSEVCNFTGVNDAHDDMVDALASAFSAIQISKAPPIQTFGVRSTAGLRSAF